MDINQVECMGSVPTELSSLYLTGNVSLEGGVRMVEGVVLHIEGGIWVGGNLSLSFKDEASPPTVRGTLYPILGTAFIGSFQRVQTQVSNRPQCGVRSSLEGSNSTHIVVDYVVMECGGALGAGGIVGVTL